MSYLNLFEAFCVDKGRYWNYKPSLRLWTSRINAHWNLTKYDFILPICVLWIKHTAVEWCSPRIINKKHIDGHLPELKLKHRLYTEWGVGLETTFLRRVWTGRENVVLRCCVLKRLPEFIRLWATRQVLCIILNHWRASDKSQAICQTQLLLGCVAPFGLRPCFRQQWSPEFSPIL